jgi:hypothetical protein
MHHIVAMHACRAREHCTVPSAARKRFGECGPVTPQCSVKLDCVRFPTIVRRSCALSFTHNTSINAANNVQQHTKCHDTQLPKCTLRGVRARSELPVQAHVQCMCHGSVDDVCIHLGQSPTYLLDTPAVGMLAVSADTLAAAADTLAVVVGTLAVVVGTLAVAGSPVVAGSNQVEVLAPSLLCRELSFPDHGQVFGSLK